MAAARACRQREGPAVAGVPLLRQAAAAAAAAAAVPATPARLHSLGQCRAGWGEWGVGGVWPGRSLLLQILLELRSPQAGHRAAAGAVPVAVAMGIGQQAVVGAAAKGWTCVGCLH
jgi:hypothetical protein